MTKVSRDPAKSNELFTYLIELKYINNYEQEALLHWPRQLCVPPSPVEIAHIHKYGNF